MNWSRFSRLISIRKSLNSFVHLSFLVLHQRMYFLWITSHLRGELKFCGTHFYLFLFLLKFCDKVGAMGVGKVVFLRDVIYEWPLKCFSEFKNLFFLLDWDKSEDKFMRNFSFGARSWGCLLHLKFFFISVFRRIYARNIAITIFIIYGSLFCVIFWEIVSVSWIFFWCWNI